jgi:hypothetical protein
MNSEERLDWLTRLLSWERQFDSRLTAGACAYPCASLTASCVLRCRDRTASGRHTVPLDVCSFSAQIRRDRKRAHPDSVICLAPLYRSHRKATVCGMAFLHLRLSRCIAGSRASARTLLWSARSRPSLWLCGMSRRNIAYLGRLPTLLCRESELRGARSGRTCTARLLGNGHHPID